MKIHPITTSELCVYEFDLSKDFDFKLLKHQCLEHVNSYQAKQHTGHSNIKSDGFFAHSVTDNFNNLIATIETKTNEISKSQEATSGVRASWKVLETWVLVYKKLGYVHEHHHYPFGFSSVCYISAENTCPIYFHDVEFKTKTGQLLIFPGSLKHYVKPLTPKHSERIVFASNLYAKFDTRILERNYSYSKSSNTNNFYFDFLPPIQNNM